MVPTRGVLGTEDTGVDIDIGRSPPPPFERNMLRRLVPARPNDASSNGGGVSLPSRSGIEWNAVSIEGDRGRFAPNRPRSADTATEGGRLNDGEDERTEGAGEVVPASEGDGAWELVSGVDGGEGDIGGGVKIPCARIESITSRSTRGSSPLLWVIAPRPARTDLRRTKGLG